MEKVIRIGLFSRAINEGWVFDGIFKEMVSIFEKNSELDIILCAGYTIRDAAYFKKFCNKFMNGKTRIFCEVGTYAGFKKKGLQPYLVGGGDVIRLPRQIGVTHSDLDSGETMCRLLSALEKREFIINGMKTLLISCGEINVLRGNQFRWAQRPDLLSRFDRTFNAADIILHPVHDRMSRSSVVDSKGENISSGSVAGDGRSRLYCRSTNWNASRIRSGRRQYRNIDQLHKVFYSGYGLKLNELDTGRGVLFSVFELNFNKRAVLTRDDV